MANTKSAKKRIKINERNRLKNKIYKGNIKDSIQKFIINLEQYSFSKAIIDQIAVKDSLKLAYSQIDKAVKNNIFHPKKALRQKSHISNLFLK